MMKHFSILIVCLLLLTCGEQQTEVVKLKVGVAQQSVNPEMGAFIAGDRNNRQFTAIHDSLYVKAMVLSREDENMAILTFDCIGMLYPTLLEIRQEVSSQIPASELDPSHIVMTSTHTHSGPDVVGIWGPDQLTSGVDPEYMKSIVRKSSEAIIEAWNNRKPATAVFAETEHGEDWVYNISDSLNLDRSLTSLQFLDSDGNSIATLNNFACHPTIMDASSSEVSSDYVSSLYSTLDNKLGGVNLFLQGAIGGWVQPEHEPKTFESVEKRGRELANAISEALQTPTKLDSDSLNYRNREIQLPVTNPNFQQLAALGVINRAITDSVTTEIAWFSIGNAQFVTHPGETTPTHSHQSKKLMTKQGPKFVLGLGMDALGYILTPDFYVENPEVKHTGYLTGMSVDPNAGIVLMERIKELSLE